MQGLDVLSKGPCMPSDLESQAEWRERLRSLNTVIASTREPLLGNLFYDDAQDEFVDSLPIDRYRFKRDRFRAALRKRRRLLEVGVNGGHSAYLALTENKELEYHGVDICENAYVEQAVAWLKNEFPGRVFFYKGDSRRILPGLASEGLTFDVFHIDGAKYVYYVDIVNSSRMVSPSGALVVVDDAEQLGVRIALLSLASFNVITRLPKFPSMPRLIGSAESNEVRGLVPSSGTKYIFLNSFSYALATARQTKALAVAALGISGLRSGNNGPN